MLSKQTPNKNNEEISENCGSIDANPILTTSQTAFAAQEREESRDAGTSESVALLRT